MININDKFTTAIMLGGLSQRMGGGIKSLEEFNNKSILDRILEKINSKDKKVIINCNSNKLNPGRYNLPIIKDSKLGYLGPLAGIHACFHWLSKNDHQTKWLITIPGDTPFIPFDLIDKFQSNISSKSKIIIAKSSGKIHPIIGAWNVSLFQNLDENLNKGTRKIMEWAKKHPINYIEYDATTFDPFFNINTKKDLLKAAEIEKKFF